MQYDAILYQRHEALAISGNHSPESWFAPLRQNILHLGVHLYIQQCTAPTESTYGIPKHFF